MQKSKTSPQTGTNKNKPVQKTIANAVNSEFSLDQIMLDDASIITDILTTHKTLVKNYSVALTEGSNEKIRKIITTNLSEAANDQFEIFNYMANNNLYPIEPAPPQKLTEAKNKFKKEEKCLNKKA